ncbi:MAG: glycosyltransferase family protein [Alkalispirochaetaceae bacterium]
MGITVLSLYDRISTFHTLAPFLQQPPPGVSFTFTDSADWCLRKDRNEVLFMVRQFLKPNRVDFRLLERLRERYRRIYFFNGNAGGALHRPEVLPYVDRFYNKALFRDRRLYTEALYGNEAFADFNHRTYGVTDEPEESRGAVPEGELEKLHIHWNIGIGDFPRAKWRQRAGVLAARSLGPGTAKLFYAARELLRPPRGERGGGAATPRPPRFDNPRPIDLHARLGRPGYRTIAYHRELIMEALDGWARHSGATVPTAKVSNGQYNREIASSKIVLSPFGWGELCFRDFEAVHAGALLLKPDMGHLETWPDIYRPGETYVPIAWDGGDLAEKVEHYLAHREERIRIARRAFEVYAESLTELPERVAAITRGADA